MMRIRGMMIWAVVTLGVVLISGGTTAQARTVVFYVAPCGNDAWSGTLPVPAKDKGDGPLATVAGARDTIRRLKSAGPLSGPVKVLLREGEYRLSAPLEFSSQDSGTPYAPIVYAAYPRERVVLSGGRPVTGWKREGNLWTADIPEVRQGTWVFSSLWVNGKRCTPARIPNEGYLFAETTVPDPENPGKGSRQALRFTPGDIQHWQPLNDVRVVVTSSWETSTHYIADINDTDHIVAFTGPANTHFGTWTMPIPYHVENALEGLDQPGEWCVNRTTGVVYYMPRPGEDMTHAEVIAPVVQQLLVLGGDAAKGEWVEFLQFEGLTFAYTDYTVGPKGHSDPQAAYGVTGAIQAKGARYCRFQDCEVAHTSNHGIWLADGCLHNRIQHNNLHDLGAGGVRVGTGGAGATPEQTTSWNEVDNNWIHGGGRVFPSGCGVWIGASPYNTVSHNEIFDMYYTGVSVGWSWGYGASAAHHNIVEYNHIHRIGQDRLSDMGGIYTLGISPGTILRNNLIHDVWSMTYGGWGIYPDEGSSDILIENNVVFATKSGGFHQHYGKENRVRNNIFAFSNEGQIIRTREEEHRSFFFEKNIVLYDNGRLLGSNYGNGRYAFEDNLYWDYSGKPVTFSGQSFEQWRAKGYDLRSVVADPQMVDPRKGDFRLRKNSPAFELGFRPIDMSTVGLYGSSGWVNGPKKEARKAAPYPRADVAQMLFDQKYQNRADAIPLPVDWLFRMDPDRVGEQERWAIANPKRDEWRALKVGSSWEEQLSMDYDGLAWYRTEAAIPSDIQERKVLLVFGAVDETAVVCVNGEKAGAFGALGVASNIPFEIDITPCVKAGAVNTIAVQVEDSTGLGGITKPVRLFILRK